MDIRKWTKKLVVKPEPRRSKRLNRDHVTKSQDKIENEDSNSKISNDKVRYQYESEHRSVSDKSKDESGADSEISDSDNENESMKIRYMKERVKIDLKRKRILEELNIVTLNQELQATVNREEAKKKSKQFHKSTKPRTSVVRKSLRVQKREAIPPELIIHEGPADTSVTNEYDVTNDKFPLSAVGFENMEVELVDSEKQDEIKKAYHDYDSFVDSLKATPLKKLGSTAPVCSDAVKENLRMMTLMPENVQKVTKKRVFSMTIHPCSSNLLVAAGDTVGNLGLWKPLTKDSNNGTYMYRASGSAISTLKFSATNSNKLYMSSYSGQLRCMDLERAVIEKAFLHDEGALSSFDFVGSGHSIIAAHRNGDITIYDTRETKETAVKTYEGHGSPTKCISCHPVEQQYFLTSHLDGSVRFFDMRNAPGKNRKSFKEIFHVGSHGKSVNAAYFSPLTGNTVLTTCLDDMLRVFDSKVISKDQVKLRASCRHCNSTGRWLTPFKAAWHPESEDIFVVGSMSRPRQIEVYNAYAKKIHSLMNLDTLTTVTSVNCLFKNNYLFGGNSSGRVHMFSNIF